MTIRVQDESSQLFLFTVVPGIFTGCVGFLFYKAIIPYNYYSLPFIYLYFKYTCPTIDIFDIKSELKYLLLKKENEGGKPLNYLQRKWNKFNATLTTEIATGAGYDMTILNFGGAIKLIKARVPLVHTDFYWLGLLGKWRYMLCTQFDDSDLVETQKNK